MTNTEAKWLKEIRDNTKQLERIAKRLDAMSRQLGRLDRKTEPQTDYTPDCPFCARYGTDECLRDKCRHYQTYKDEPQAEDAYAYDEDDWYDKMEREGE